MEKKVYVKPAMQVYGLEPTTLLTMSGGDNGKRGELYDEIPVNNEFCETPE